jgi:hypothetical protein
VPVRPPRSHRAVMATGFHMRGSLPFQLIPKSTPLEDCECWKIVPIVMHEETDTRSNGPADGGSVESISPGISSTIETTAFRIIRHGDRKVLAAPENPKQALSSAVKCLPEETLRRRGYKALLSIATGIGLGGLITHRAKPPILPIDLAELIDRRVFHRGTRMGPRNASYGVARWPSQPDRRRLYFHVFDKNDQQVVFLKIGLDEENSSFISREADALRSLNGNGGSAFKVPSVYWFRRIGECSVLALEAISNEFKYMRSTKAAYPAEAVREYAGPPRQIESPTLHNLSWGPSAYTWADHGELFLSELANIATSLQVVRAHGDLGVHNMAYRNGHPWIFDWERFTVDAPMYTDRVGFELSSLSRRVTTRPAEWRTTLDNLAPSLGRMCRKDLMFALAFRACMGMQDARAIIGNWSKSKGWGIQ